MGVLGTWAGFAVAVIGLVLLFLLAEMIFDAMRRVDPETPQTWLTVSFFGPPLGFWRLMMMRRQAHRPEPLGKGRTTVMALGVLAYFVAVLAGGIMAVGS